MIIMLPFNRIVAVVIILLLIISLILITLLGQSTNQVSTLSESNSVCATNGDIACKTNSYLPSTWIMNRAGTGNDNRTCAQMLDCSTCEECGFLA